MAFCNSCGTRLENDAQFCPKCGAAQAAGTAPGVSTQAAQTIPQAQARPTPSPAARPLLITLGIGLAVLGLCIVAATIFGLHVARHTHVQNRDGNVRVDTPFGTVETTTNPSDAARQLGVDLYPGAHVLKSNTANIGIAGVNAVAAELESDDPADKVADFYKTKFPDATVKVSGSRYEIVAKQKDNLVTIKIEPQGDKTHIKVATVTGKGVGNAND